MESLNDLFLVLVKLVDVMEIQRECLKLVFALGYILEVVYFFFDSIVQYSNLGDIDLNVGVVNSRLLFVFVKWLFNDRKLLIVVIKINGNGFVVVIKISLLCELEVNYVSFGYSIFILVQDELLESYLNFIFVLSVVCGVIDVEFVCGQFLYLVIM